jgi:methylmalonyl-CoA mutase
MTDHAMLPALTEAFAAAGRDDWMALVTKALKGADFNRRLVARTADGLAIEPIYNRRADAAVIAGMAAARPWEVTVRVDHPDRQAASTLALADLEGGAGGIALVFAGSAAARGFGINAGSVAELDACLANVMLDLVQLRLEPAANGRANAAMVAVLVTRRGYNPARMKISFGLDPIGVLAWSGSLPVLWPQTAERLAETIAGLRRRGFNGPFITCDIRPFNEAGCSEAQELAVALAAGLAYVRALEAAGMPAAEAFSSLSWTLAVDSDQFLSIAKLRALRRLWAQVTTSSGVAAAAIAIHAETAWRTLTRRDPAVNMLRATTAAFAAAVGGADSITVLPHTSALGLPDALSRRIARNTQLVLQEETNLWRVADPAAGAGAIEGLTDALCEAGWRAFQEIEREGGLVASLTAGAIQGRIAAIASARQKDIATRKAPITGTSEFPTLAEAAGGVLDVQPVAVTAGSAGDARTFDELVAAFDNDAAPSNPGRAAAGAVQAARLPSTRLAEPYEALREAADAAAASSGKRAQVFLANLGPPAEHGGRATWIANLLAAGGIEAIASDGFSSSQAAAAAFAASGAGVACICGSDDSYALQVEATASALKTAGARHVVLAGKAASNEAALLAAGVDQFLFAGQDVIAALRRLHGILGIGIA